MTEKELVILAESLVKDLKEKGKTLALAESCTGGWMSKIITDVSGASAVYNGGVCSYSNSVKTAVLGVSEDVLNTQGAVCAQVSLQMAQGVRNALGSDLGVGITGIAGPLSDGSKKPVGLIYITVAEGNRHITKELRNNFTEDIRNQNRLSAVFTAIKLCGEILK